MPSPIGHALAGIAAGWLVDPPAPGSRHAVAARAAVFALAGAAADLDLLTGMHRGPTHSLGAAAAVGVTMWVVRLRARGGFEGAGRGALALAAAYASHTLLDWLGNDTFPPVGIMALWPFSHDYYQSRLHLFLGISRRYWLREFWIGNLAPLARELAILLPMVAMVVAARRRRGATDA